MTNGYFYLNHGFSEFDCHYPVNLKTVCLHGDLKWVLLADNTILGSRFNETADIICMKKTWYELGKFIYT